MVTEASGLLLAGRRAEGESWPILGERVSCLLPAATRSLTARALDGFRAAGLQRAVIVIDTASAEAVRERVADGAAWGLDVQYVELDEPHGPGHALRAAEALVGDGPVLVQR